MAGIMQGGGDGLQNGRAEGFYARGIRYIPGLFTTPYSPPKPHARAERHPCKIHSQHHQHQQTAHTTPPHQPHRHRQHRGQSHTAQHHQHRQTAHTTAPQHHSQRQHTPQPASTTPGRADRHDEGGDRRDDHHRPGPEGVGTPGGDCKVCGFGSAKVF